MLMSYIPSSIATHQYEAMKLKKEMKYSITLCHPTKLSVTNE